MADSMQQSVDRLAKSYEHWTAERATRMLRMLSADLASAGPKGRLCRCEGITTEGTRVSWFYVDDGAGKQVGEAFDDSFLCPPIC